MANQDKLPSEHTHKVRNMLNYKPGKGKKFTQKSLTVPDMSMSIKTILERHTRGLPVNASIRTPIYEEEESSGIDYRTLDLADIEQLKKENQQEIQTLKLKMQHEEQQRKEAAEKKARAQHEQSIQQSKDGDSTDRRDKSDVDSKKS